MWRTARGDNDCEMIVMLIAPPPVMSGSINAKSVVRKRDQLIVVKLFLRRNIFQLLNNAPISARVADSERCLKVNAWGNDGLSILFPTDIRGILIVISI